MIFALAEKLHTSPLEISKWPATLFQRARFWLSARNQAEADRAENEEAYREATAKR